MAENERTDREQEWELFGMAIEDLEKMIKQKSKNRNTPMTKVLIDWLELGVCTQCHTPKIKTALGYMPDKNRFLSGYAQNQELPDLPYAEIMAGEAEKTFYTTDATVWVGRWGVSFAANLTPDPETGIGSWEEEDFIDIFRDGKHFGQENPRISPMPVNVYSQLRFFELGSIFMYLQTIPPVSNEVPTRIPPEDKLFEGRDS